MIDEIVTDPEIQGFMKLFREMLDKGEYGAADDCRLLISDHPNYETLEDNPSLMLEFLDYSIELYKKCPVEEEELPQIASFYLGKLILITHAKMMKRTYSKTL